MKLSAPTILSLYASHQSSVRRSYRNRITMNSKESNVIPWNNDTIYALGLVRILGRIIGAWPINRYKYLIYSQMILYPLIQLVMGTFYFQNLITKGGCNVMMDLVDALSITTTTFSSIAKMIVPHIYRESLYIVINSAIEDWNNIESEKARKIMLSYAYMGRAILIVQMCGVYVMALGIISGNLPTLDVKIHESNMNNTELFRNIPHGPNCWISPSLSETVYLLYYFTLASHFIMLCTVYIGFDAYIFGITMHVCGQFEVLYYNIENLDGTENYFTVQKKIRQLTQRHIHLLMLANKFEDIFNSVTLVELLTCSFLMAVAGIAIILGLQTGDTELIIISAFRVHLLYCALFIYCYIGESLTTHAEKLQVAIYNCTWYEMSPSLIRDLIFIMMRNNYLCHLTAGKLYNMNIQNFQNVMKKIFAFFSVIRLMLTE